MRVFLHDLLWQQDAAGFHNASTHSSTIAAKHHIKLLFVLFDSVLGSKSRNSASSAPHAPASTIPDGCKAPARKRLQDPSQYPRLEAYVKGVVGAFANDQRILGWDVWNEPDNTNDGNYQPIPQIKSNSSPNFLPQVFAWARSRHPIAASHQRPLAGRLGSRRKTSPPSRANKSNFPTSSPSTTTASPRSSRAASSRSQPYHRPLLCTEYMARGNGSTFQGTLPVAKKYNVGAINWGLVEGKTQTDSAVGFLAAPLYRSPAANVVPRNLPHRRHALQRTEVNFIRTITGRGTSRYVAGATAKSLPSAANLLNCRDGTRSFKPRPRVSPARHRPDHRPRRLLGRLTLRPRAHTRHGTPCATLFTLPSLNPNRRSTPPRPKTSASTSSLTRRRKHRHAHRRIRFFLQSLFPCEGAGSGFLIDKDGHILTNFHVVQGAQHNRGHSRRSIGDKKRAMAKLIGDDPRNDIALIQID